jgi:hypothetical protein
MCGIDQICTKPRNEHSSTFDQTGLGSDPVALANNSKGLPASAR